MAPTQWFMSLAASTSVLPDALAWIMELVGSDGAGHHRRILEGEDMITTNIIIWS
jgi:hypothetical protein